MGGVPKPKKEVRGEAVPPTSSQTVCIVDGHAHLYPSFDLRVALETAWGNFQRHRQTLQIGPSTPGILSVVDPSGNDSIDLLCSSSARKEIQPWSVEVLDGGDACRIWKGHEEEGAVVFVVAGRQIKAGCGLEVLAMGTRDTYPDGLQFEEALEAVRSGGCRPIVPWGFGKWYGKRGRKVLRCLEASPGADSVLLGDSFNRPVGSPTPRAFRKAKETRVFILPGTDPLSFPRQESKLGGFCYIWEGVFDPKDPAGSLRTGLRTLVAQPREVGARGPLFPQLKDQLRVQVSKMWPSQSSRR